MSRATSVLPYASRVHRASFFLTYSLLTSPPRKMTPIITFFGNKTQVSSLTSPFAASVRHLTK